MRRYPAYILSIAAAFVALVFFGILGIRKRVRRTKEQVKTSVSAGDRR